MICLAPQGKKRVISIGRKETIEIPLGYYVYLDLRDSTIQVRNLITDTLQCVHPLGKKTIKLQDKYIKGLTAKAEKGEFRKIKTREIYDANGKRDV